MKQKYTLTVADTEINVITDEPLEEIETVVGIVDRHLREIHLRSRSCSRTEATLLVALDYCSEKLKLRKKLKAADIEINRLAALNDATARENAALTREIEALRKNLNMAAISQPEPTRVQNPVQLSFEESVQEAAPEEKAEQAKPAETKSEKKANPVRSMFDYITFDDI